MGERVAFLTGFLVLGALLWFERIGVWHHPAYGLCLMVLTLSWFAYTTEPRNSP